MKKTILTIVQIAITVGILWLVFRDPVKREQMATALSYANPLWILGGLAVYGIVEFIAGVRWQLLLRVQGIHLSWPRVFMLLMIGIFFNFFVPGGTGGDVVKVFYLLKETPGRRAPALLSVLVDRIIGLFSLIALAGVLIAFHWKWLTSNPQTAAWVWTALAILASAFLGIGSSFFVTGFGLVHRLPAKMPGRDRLAELSLAYNLYGRAWPTTLLSFCVSVVAHLAYFLTFFCAAQSFAAVGVRSPTYGELCAIMPIVNTITSMPISFGGIGIREGLFEVFLGNLAGVTQAVAVLTSSIGYALTLIWGLFGGLLYIFYRPSEHVKLREMTDEVASFEHRVAEAEIALETGAEMPGSKVEP